MDLNNHSPQLCIPYKQLAHIYDHIMSHVDYKTWMKYVVKIIKRDVQIPVRLLDIGCGTGQFIQQIQRNNIAADGCDISPAMLEIAKKRNYNCNFWLDALPDLKHTPSQHYSVMTCLYDTINYLAGEQEVTSTLQRIYQLLPRGGIFLFDVVSEICCKTYFDDLQESEEFENGFTYERTANYDATKKQQITHFTIHSPQGRFSEVHTQKIFSFRELKELIQTQSEFKVTGIYEEFTFFSADENSNRAHFVLKKE